MTAMCDVAFLLLTFFMLAAQFRPDEPVLVDTPSSVSEIKLPESDIILITLAQDGKVFFGIDNQLTKLELIKQMGQKYGITFTDEEATQFALASSIGVPVGSLKQYLAVEGAARRQIQQPGIPVDSTQNELRDWVDLARRLNPTVPRVAIKGDQDAHYAVVKKVVGTLQELNINRFNMITSLEAKPEGMPGAQADEGEGEGEAG
jgi:biopolymer transport protein ExbD